MTRARLKVGAAELHAPHARFAIRRTGEEEYTVLDAEADPGAARSTAIGVYRSYDEARGRVKAEQRREDELRRRMGELLKEPPAAEPPEPA